MFRCDFIPRVFNVTSVTYSSAQFELFLDKLLRIQIMNHNLDQVNSVKEYLKSCSTVGDLVLNWSGQIYKRLLRLFG